MDIKEEIFYFFSQNKKKLLLQYNLNKGLCSLFLQNEVVSSLKYYLISLRLIYKNLLMKYIFFRNIKYVSPLHPKMF